MRDIKELIWVNRYSDTDHFTVRKLNRHLKELEQRQASIHWSMQFDDLNKEEIEKNNYRLAAIELDRRITQGRIYSYDV